MPGSSGNPLTASAPRGPSSVVEPTNDETGRGILSKICHRVLSDDPDGFGEVGSSGRVQEFRSDNSIVDGKPFLESGAASQWYEMPNYRLAPELVNTMPHENGPFPGSCLGCWSAMSRSRVAAVCNASEHGLRVVAWMHTRTT
jgi:hypothetical protein